jgi:uncharacterized membrane protein
MPFDFAIAVESGLWATVLMTLFYTWALSVGMLHLDFALLLGDVVMPRRRLSVVVGLLLHFISGTVFAVLYAGLFWRVGLQPAPLAMLVGAGFGVFHFLLAMPLIHLAGNLGARHRRPGEANPGEWGINYGPQEAALRLVGHMLYGATVAGIYAALVLAPEYRPISLACAVMAAIGLIVFYTALFQHQSLEIHRRHGLQAPVRRFPSAGEVMAAREALKRRLDNGEISFEEYQRQRRRYAGEP